MSSDFDPTTLLGYTLPTGHTLTAILGIGSFAIVYHATHPTSAPVAIKTLFKTSLSPHQLEIQKSELTYHKAVSNHPHVVTLYDVVETDEYVFMIMEECEDDLFGIIEGGYFGDFDRDDSHPTRNHVDTKKVLQVFTQLCVAIQYCHQKGIAHRDLKPENIFVGHESGGGGISIRVGDFGLSTTEKRSWDYGVGSVGYMSPEQLGVVSRRGSAQTDSAYDSGEEGGRGYDTFKGDVWALGIILVNMLTGRSPWGCARDDHDGGDAYYREYVTVGPRFFVTSFGFSEGFSVMLDKIFCGEGERVGIGELVGMVGSVGVWNEGLSESGWGNDFEEMDFGVVPDFGGVGVEEEDERVVPIVDDVGEKMVRGVDGGGVEFEDISTDQTTTRPITSSPATTDKPTTRRQKKRKNKNKNKAKKCGDEKIVLPPGSQVRTPPSGIEKGNHALVPPTPRNTITTTPLQILQNTCLVLLCFLGRFTNGRVVGVGVVFVYA